MPLVIVGAVLAFRETPAPRGCGCISACATAQEGCFSCPCVPWYNVIAGFILFLFSLSFVTLANISDQDFELVLAEKSAVPYHLIQVIAGAAWLRRIGIEQGFWCCAPNQIPGR